MFQCIASTTPFLKNNNMENSGKSRQNQTYSYQCIIKCTIPTTAVIWYYSATTVILLRFFYNNILVIVNSGFQYDVVTLDFNKAFNSMTHRE